MIRTGVYASEADELGRLATGRRVLEFGTWYGFSAVTMARTATSVTTVDWHHGDQHAGHEDTLAGFMRNIAEAGVADRITTIVERFERVVPMLARDYFEVGFLDGLHDRTSVERDLELITSLLDRPGCVLACHDWNRSLGDARFEVDDAVVAFGQRHPEWVHSHTVESLYVMERRA